MLAVISAPSDSCLYAESTFRQSHCLAAAAGPGTSLLHTDQLRIQEQFSQEALVIAVRVTISYQKIFIASVLITVGQQ